MKAKLDGFLMMVLGAVLFMVCWALGFANTPVWMLKYIVASCALGIAMIALGSVLMLVE